MRLRRQDGAGLPHGLRATRVIAIAFAAVLASSLLASFVALGHHAPASSDLCGAVITKDLKLDHDLVCPRQGIIVGADGIEIELKGHSITGPGNVFGNFFIGIRVEGRSDVEIAGPGTVTGFLVGIAIAGSTDVSVEKLDIVGNGRGTGDGIRVWSSTDVEIEKNRIAGNRADGIDIRASTDVEVEKNEIRGNTVGVNIGAGATGNSFEKNRIAENGCGVRGPVAGSTFEKNRFENNVVDFC